VRASLISAALVAAVVMAPPAFAAFPGKNGQIAFYKSKNGRSDIWVMRPKGGKPRDVTNTAAIFETAPSFSPNGRRIAFYWLSSESTRQGQMNGIGVVNANGSGMRDLTSGPQASDFYSSPHWSADGKRIVYTRGHNDANGEPVNAGWSIPAGGGAQQQITADDVHDVITSPIGRQLAYLAFNPQGNDFLQVTDSNGANPVTVGGPPHVTDFSPDGQRVVYSYKSKIFSKLANGTGAPMLIADKGANDLDPVYSPDGRFVLWSNEGSHDLWIARASGGGARNVSHRAGFEKQPSWGRGR
jgi:Tol biopolymer transport system component